MGGTSKATRTGRPRLGHVGFCGPRTVGLAGPAWKYVARKMLATLIPGLIIAAAGGLAFLAYRQPRAFALIEKVLLGIAVLVYAGLTVWNLGILQGCGSIYSPDAKIDIWKLSKLYKTCTAQEIPHVFAWFLGVLGYLTFLAILPKVIAYTSQDKRNIK